MIAGAASGMPSSVRQHTVARAASWRGERRRRRTDVLRVHAAEVDTGIRFVCLDAPPAAGAIAAHWDAVVDTRGGVVLGNTHGVTLRGVTPLLAALRMTGVDNAVVEVPGSGLPTALSDFGFYLDMLAEVGVQEQASARRLLRVVDTVEVRDSCGFVVLAPATEFRARINTASIQPGGHAAAACAALLSNFTEPHAAPSESDAATIASTGERSRLRLASEIRALPEVSRAAAVELIGHLALAGAPMAGYVRAHGAGPGLYQALLRAVMERRAAALTTVDAHRAWHPATARSGAAPVGCPDSGSRANGS